MPREMREAVYKTPRTLATNEVVVAPNVSFSLREKVAEGRMRDSNGQSTSISDSITIGVPHPDPLPKGEGENGPNTIRVQQVTMAGSDR